MIIKNLQLLGYKRFFLRNISKLEYTPNKPLQIILGSNGVGKSSLLRMLNPLPGNKKDFNLGGSKIITIEHRGDVYELTSRGNGKHSFKHNGVELNTSGNITNQLVLVQQHFNLTPEIVDILLNTVQFCNMGVMDRRKWISQLSTVDYSYSVSVYNKLKSRCRDIQGGIKLLGDSIIKSEANCYNLELLKKLEMDKKILEDLHTHVVSLYDHSILSSHEIDIRSITSRLSTLLDLGVKGSITELEEEVIKTKTMIEHLNTNIQEVLSKIEEMKSISSITDLQKLEDELRSKEEYLGVLEKSNIYAIPVKQIESVIVKFTLLTPDVITILNMLEEYSSVNIDKAYEEELNIKFTKLEDLIILLKNKTKLASEEIEHINQHNSVEHLVECPKCSCKWYKGYDAKKVEKLEGLVKEYNNKLEQAKKVINFVKEELSKITTKNELILQFKNILRSNPDLNLLWNKIVDQIDFKVNSIGEILTLWNQVTFNLHKIQELPSVDQDVIDLKKNIETYKEVNLKYHNSKLEDLLLQHENLNNKKHELILKLKNETEYRLDILKKIKDTELELKAGLFALKKNLKNEIKKERNKVLLDYSYFIKEQIVEIDSCINNNNVIIAKLEDDKKILEEYKIKYNVMDKMLLALSPTEGLIAKSINSFLSVFVQEMNDVISKIWTYDLEILPCDISNGDDLDYKFRVKINNSEVIEDISKLSSSGKEIVNLAFRLVFMKYMKISDMPLYLDEFGSTMDKAHTQAAYSVIDKIMASEYPQVFFISHNESQYGSLHLCDFNVLDSNNIGLETIKEYNKNLVIE